MKIVRIIGGLGNQMFQYALAVALRARFPEDDIKIDISCFRGYGLHNGYEIERIFPNASIPKASFKEIARLSYPYPNNWIRRLLKRILPQRKNMIVEQDDWLFERKMLEDQASKYIDGYWQNEDYFKDFSEKIHRVFEIPPFIDKQNIELSRIICKNNVASIHVRRGDYVGHSLLGGICDKEYYSKAISLLKEKCDIGLWVMFSDNIDWMKENIIPLLGNDRYVVVDWNTREDSFRDMQLMSLCNHNIIANSSFSWWGAWLNKNSDKIVIAPSRWLNKPDVHSPVCKDWMTL